MAGESDIDRDIERLLQKFSQTSARTPNVLSELVKDIEAPILVTDDSGNFITATAGACALLGYRCDELVGKSIPDITAAGSLDVHERLWNSFTRTGKQSGRYDLVRKDGGVIRVAYEAFWDVAPGVHISFLRPES